MNPKQFAELVLLAVELREGSWNGKYYFLRMDQAALEACKRKLITPDPDYEFTRSADLEWAQPLCLLLLTAWNDIQLWAKEQEKEHVA